MLFPITGIGVVPFSSFFSTQLCNLKEQIFPVHAGFLFILELQARVFTFSPRRTFFHTPPPTLRPFSPPAQFVALPTLTSPLVLSEPLFFHPRTPAPFLLKDPKSSLPPFADERLSWPLEWPRLPFPLPSRAYKIWVIPPLLE